jgi:hypothetical protein
MLWGGGQRPGQRLLSCMPGLHGGVCFNEALCGQITDQHLISTPIRSFHRLE